MNLTPLIDVVFLLLIFFMMASTFLKFGTVKLEAAGSGNATVDLSRIALIHIGASESLYIAGIPVEPAQLPEALRRLKADGKSDAVIVVRKDATAADLLTGLARVRQHGFTSVRVVD